MIAISGCLPRMPGSYPLDTAENAGNMIHARAPQRILKGARTMEYHTQPWARFSGETSFVDFVNKHCDHLIISMTNTIKVNAGWAQRYVNFQRLLERYDVPITIFGLGVRSPTDDLSQATIPDEAVTMLRYLEQRAGPIGVRGEFTKQVFATLAGVTDVQVTGCPSFFSEPGAFAKLRKELASPRRGTYTYAGTRYERPEELAQLVKSVQGDGYYIEATNKENHRAHLQALKGDPLDVPSFLAGAVVEEPEPTSRRFGLGRARSSTAVPHDRVTRTQLADFFRHRYRLFRNPDDWLQFNREVVAYGFGTRFHVNMATLLSGKPATWIAHDTRTREFCDFLHLPQVSLEDSVDMEPEDFRAAVRYEEMFDHLPQLFDNWASYLGRHNLPYSTPKL